MLIMILMVFTILIHAYRDFVHNSTTNELIVKVHERRDAKDPIRYVYTTAFERTYVSASSVIDNITKIIPGYTLYAKTYLVCDRFNKNLHDRT